MTDGPTGGGRRDSLRRLHRGGGEGVTGHVAIGARTEIVIAQTATIEGTVRSTQPMPDIAVVARDTTTGIERREDFFMTGGRYAFRDLPAGRYLVIATVGAREAMATVEVKAGERRTGVDLDLGATTVVTGRIVELVSRKPVAGISVAYGGDHRHVRERFVRRNKPVTDAAGRFTLDAVPAGLTRFLFREDERDRFGETEAMLSIAGERVDLGDIAIASASTSGDADVGFARVSYPLMTPSSACRMEVETVKAGGPADGKLVPGDVITTINGIDVTRGNYPAGSSLLRVKPGTALALGLARGETVTVVAR